MGFSLNNLAVTATNSAMTSAMGHLLDTLYSKLANGGRDSNCKFYYSGPGAGGSILQVATKGIVGGAVSALKDEATNAFNSWWNGKKAKESEIEDYTGWCEKTAKGNEADKAKYGKFLVNEEKKYNVLALDDWGGLSYDALMLGIKLDSKIMVTQSFPVYETFKSEIDNKYYESQKDVESNTFESEYLVWYDTTAIITVNSDKNMVISRVQGRDYSRKELVSNGDIKFSVSGQITSGRPDVYPADEVKKFIKIMKYKGIVKINNQILDQFGVEHIVITDFNLSAKEGHKSVQYYTFNAIGLQPSEEISITHDTVEIYRQNIVGFDNDDTAISSEWENMLKNQLAGLKSMAGDIVNQGAALATGMLDSKL